MPSNDLPVAENNMKASQYQSANHEAIERGAMRTAQAGKRPYTIWGRFCIEAMGDALAHLSPASIAILRKMGAKAVPFVQEGADIVLDTLGLRMDGTRRHPYRFRSPADRWGWP